MIDAIKRKLVIYVTMIFILFLIGTMSVLYLILENSFYNSARTSAFSISNSIYIAMNEVLFDGANITAFMATDPFLTEYFFSDEGLYLPTLSAYLENVSTVYGYEDVYVASFNTNNRYGKSGNCETYKKTNPADTWFFDKASSDFAKDQYEGLLVNHNDGTLHYYMTYGISNSNDNPLGLILLGIDYNQAMSLITSNAEHLGAELYLVTPEGVYENLVPVDPLSEHRRDEISALIDFSTESQEFNFVRKDNQYISSRYVPEINRHIVIIQSISNSMFSTFALTFLVVVFILLVIVLIILRMFKNSSNRIFEQASLDTLTGIPGRSSFSTKMNEAIELSTRYSITSTLIFMDIDNFKEINDTYGHDYGDEIIQSVATVLYNTKREEDHLFRWGGDEFAMIVRCKKDQAISLSHRILESVSEINTDNQTSVTLSIGISEIQPNDSHKECFHRVDKALYEAKENGRNQAAYC